MPETIHIPNATDALAEYLVLRKSAEDFYVAHPEIARLLVVWHTHAPDKLAGEAINHANGLETEEAYRNNRDRFSR